MNRHLNNEDGQAMLESIPLIIFFVIFFAYGLGMFGIIHSGILFSIGARSYAFETFRNRTNTNIFRYSGSANKGNLVYYEPLGYRLHTVQDTRPRGNTNLQASQRRIVMGIERKPLSNSPNTHNDNVHREIKDNERNKTVEVDPAWIMVAYGLCITAECGAD